MRKRMLVSALLLAMVLSLTVTSALAWDISQGVPPELKAVLEAGGDPAAMSQGFIAHAEGITGVKHYPNTLGPALAAQVTAYEVPSDTVRDAVALENALLDALDYWLRQYQQLREEGLGWTEEEFFTHFIAIDDTGTVHQFSSYQEAIDYFRKSANDDFTKNGTPIEETHSDVIRQLMDVVRAG